MELVGADGTVVVLRAEPVLARDGVAYEVVLHVERDGEPAGVVGQRAYGPLCAASRAAQPDCPAGTLLNLRARDPDDPGGGAELRVVLREQRRWQRGWHVERAAVVDVWDDLGRGLRVVLPPHGLAPLLAGLLQECRGALGTG